MGERITNKMVTDMWARFCRAMTANGIDGSDMELEHNSIYGWCVMNKAGSRDIFGMRRRKNREMYEVMDFAIDVLNLAYKHGRARFDIVGYPPLGTKTVEYVNVGYHDALLLCEKLDAERGYSHYMDERE